MDAAVVIEKPDISEELERLGFKKGLQFIVPSSPNSAVLCGWYHLDHRGAVERICDRQGYLWDTIETIYPESLYGLNLRDASLGD